MEVEFLSNMRYSLLASKDEWEEWHQKLGKFYQFCERSIKLSPPPLYQPTLPSPPTSMQASPPTQSSQYSSVAGPYNFTPQWPATNNTAHLISPLTTISNASDPDFQPTARKRSITEDAEEPVAKRVSRLTPSTSNGLENYNMASRPRLPPVPNLTISTSQAMGGYNSLTSFSQNVPLLPPLNGSRAMSTVYPTTPTYPPIASQIPSGPHASAPHASAPQTAPYQHSNQSFGASSRPRSPQSAVQELLSSVPSPLNASFPGNSGHISPSVFYQQRNSPYKPIRHVNTLLYPPPSTSMHDYAVNTNHIHYQPLGKRHDYRSGVVPGYAHQAIGQWPVLPQPNFHGL